MKKQLRSLWFMSALALFLSVGIGLNAQQTSPPAQPPDAQAQQPSTPDHAPPPATTDHAQPIQTRSQTPSKTQDKAGKTTPQPRTERTQRAREKSFKARV